MDSDTLKMSGHQLYDIKPISEVLKPGLNLIELPVPSGMRRYVLYIRFKNKSNMKNIVEIHALYCEEFSHRLDFTQDLITHNRLLIESLEPFEISEIPKTPQLKYPQPDERNPFCLFSYSYEKTMVIRATAACNIFINYIDW